MTATYACPTQTCTEGATFTIAPVAGGFQLTTNFAVTITFVPNTLTVTVPVISELQNNVFGYCGNLDNIPSNDNYCWNPNLRNYNDYETCWPESYLQSVVTSTPGYVKLTLLSQVSLTLFHYYIAEFTSVKIIQLKPWKALKKN